jgi:hypothetical protein
MRFALIFLILISFQLLSFGQTTYTSRIGSKFFPGHLDIVVSVDNGVLRYELFNHWYAGSYAELQQMKIKLDSLNMFNQSNDSISIKILDNKIQLKDKRYRINKKVKHKNLCASPEKMRKISFAYRISTINGLGPHTLYSWDDLNMTELEFEKQVMINLDKIKK